MTIEEAMAKFPETFGLKAFPGRTFRFSRSASYMRDTEVVLYAQVDTPSGWVDFGKGTTEEFQQEIVIL